MLRTRLSIRALQKCSLLALCVAALAQEQTAPQGRGARVLIPAVATDSSGVPITGLLASDFLLKVGRTEYRADETEEVKPFLLPPDSGGQQKQPVFLVLDKLSFSAPKLGSAAQSVIRLLAQSVSTGDPVTLLTIDSDGVKLIHSFTTPTSVLSLALQQLDQRTHVLGGTFKSAAGGLDESLEQRVSVELSSLEGLSKLVQPLMGLNAASVQMESLRNIGRAGRTIPGRKAMLWITGGTPLHFDEATELMTYGSMLTEADDRRYTIEFENAVEALNDGQTSLYPVTPEVFRGNPLGDDYWKNVGLTEIAKATGGEVLPLDQDLTRAVQSARAHCATYYLLEHQRGPAPKKVEWTKVQVTAKRPNIRVQTIKGFFVLP